MNENFKESLTLSKSEEQPAFIPIGKRNSEQLAQLEKMKRVEAPLKNAGKVEGDLL